MAISLSTGAGAPDKSYPASFPSDIVPPIVDGLVQHPLLSPSLQVQILSIVDATGSASIGDIVTELPDHADPVAAIMALAAAGILTLDLYGALDANTIVSRVNPAPEPSDPSGSASNLPTRPNTSQSELPSGIDRIVANPFSAQLCVGRGSSRRGFAHLADLHRPGVYILLNANSAYVGVGGDVGVRVGGGQQPIQNIETVIAITDTNGNLSPEDARALERMLWSRLAASGERTMINGVPDGAPVEVQRYSELEAFLAQACLALHHENILFVESSARAILAGPRAEPQRLGSLRPLNQMPDGDLLELGFGNNLVSLAARQAENHWLLLRGSDVRLDTVASATCSTSFLRSAWLHSGLLALAPDGGSFMVMRDLAFASGSAVAQFCTGAKGRGLAGWLPIDADGECDPGTPKPIAA